MLRPSTMRAFSRGARGQSGRSIRKNSKIAVLLIFVMVLIYGCLAGGTI